MRKYMTLVVAVALLAACSKKKAGGDDAPVPVTLAKAVTMTVPDSITATGTVEPVNKVSVAAQVDGQLQKIFIKEGQHVLKGDPLMRIDPAPFKQRVAQAQAQLSQDQDSMKYAKAQASRYAELVSKGAAAQADSDQTDTAFKTASAKVDADKAALEQAKIDLGYTNITAPLSGKVGAFQVNEGAIVKKNETVLITVNQIVPINVRFSVPEKYISKIRTAQHAGPVQVIADPEGVRKASGTLTFVDNTVNSDTGMIMLKAEFPNKDDSLWPGEFASTTLIVGQQKDAVVIPVAAVMSGQDGKFVYVVGADNRASVRKVTVGTMQGDSCVISEGLAAGDTVVTDGQMLLKDGSLVQDKGAVAPAK